MGKFIFASALLFAFLSSMSACQETPTTSPSEIIIYPQVHLDSPNLHGRVKITKVTTERVGQNQLKARIQLQNLTALPLTVDYQYQFLNNAITIENSRPGITTTLAPYSTATISFVSNTEQVTTFDLSIVSRW